MSSLQYHCPYITRDGAPCGRGSRREEGCTLHWRLIPSKLCVVCKQTCYKGNDKCHVCNNRDRMVAARQRAAEERTNRGPARVEDPKPAPLTAWL